MRQHESWHICHNCILDKFLWQEMAGKGTWTTCKYCNHAMSALTLEELSIRVGKAIKEHFDLTPRHPGEDDFDLVMNDEWERQGKYVEEVIAEITGVNSEIAGDIRTVLEKRARGLTDIEEGEENPFNKRACYEEIGPDTADLQGTWSSFKDEINRRARFFGRWTEDLLKEIFEDLSSLTTYHGEPVIRAIEPGNTDSYIWRARAAHTPQEVKVILDSPSGELGPPPSEKATAGRMNAQGISVFYGALEESTCVAEIRAPVGAYVAIAKFEAVRPLRVLDLNMLSEVYSEISYFDSNYREKRNRDEFLKELVE